MRADIITIFPEYFAGPLTVSLIGKAAERGDVDFRLHDLRQWATDVHHAVDDAPFGGGPGMVMKPDVWGAALEAVVPEGTPARLILPTPSGVPFTQDLAAAYAAEPRLVFGCGRYEGIDSRVAAWARGRMAVDEISIGDYVLAGGEAAVSVILEAVCRLLPGVLGNASSVADDSFGGGTGAMDSSATDAGHGAQAGMAGLLEGPVFTRPRIWHGFEVPEILLSGNHAAIARWRRDEALRRTAASRPDLIARVVAGRGGLDRRDREVLAETGFPVDG